VLTRREKKQELAYCTQIHPRFSCEEGIEKNKNKKTTEITGFIQITTRELKAGIAAKNF
jgi:hypothetical protein